MIARPGIFALFIMLLLIFSCEPIVTTFDDIEEADYYQANTIKAVPDTFTVIKVMTWNIRFGCGRIPWFGDACGDRVILSEDEVRSSLWAIVQKINREQPDILLLQEVDTKAKRSAYIDELQFILDHTYFNYAAAGYQWKAQNIPGYGLGRLEEVNAILSRWKLSEGRRIQLALRGDQDKLEQYFYERPCIVTARVEIPHIDNLYAVNIHAVAFSTDDTKRKHLLRFEEELDRIDSTGGIFVAGGDLNALPPGSDTTDYCIQDMCPDESYHQPGDDPMHKEGSNYTPEVDWLNSIFSKYEPAVHTDVYVLNQYRYFTHTTRGTHFWDRTLDYLFTNDKWIENSDHTYQDATRESDHAPVSVLYKLP